MAYFEDPRNRKNWEKMMVGLRAERSRRLSGEEASSVDSMRAAKEHTRVPVPFKQLLAEHKAEMGITGPAPSLSAGMRGPQKEHEAGRGM